MNSILNPHHISFKSILILSFYLRLGPLSCLFIQVFRHEFHVMSLIRSTRSIWSTCHQSLFDHSRTRPICDGLITRSEESYCMYLILCDLQTSKMRLSRLLSCVGTGHGSGRPHTQNLAPWAAMTYSEKVWVDKVLLAEHGSLYSSSPSWTSNSFPLLPVSCSPYVQMFFFITSF